MDSQSLTPKVIKEELDRYVIGQDDAKKAVAIALRNRWRRLNVNSRICNQLFSTYIYRNNG